MTVLSLSDLEMNFVSAEQVEEYAKLQPEVLIQSLFSTTALTTRLLYDMKYETLILWVV